MTYITKTKRVAAWQHTKVDPEMTGAYPAWVIGLAAQERVRQMPDGSIHITDAEGLILPLPLQYWLVLDEETKGIHVVAPDVFAADYLEEE